MEKQKVLATLKANILSQLEEVNTDLAGLQDAKESDTKSSMGDKYETSAEMLGAEEDKLIAQQDKLQKFLLQLKNFSGDKPAVEVILGSLVETNRGWFLLGIPFGQFKVDHQIVMAISAASPVGELMAGKAKGANFDFRGIDYKILKIS